MALQKHRVRATYYGSWILERQGSQQSHSVLIIDQRLCQHQFLHFPSWQAAARRGSEHRGVAMLSLDLALSDLHLHLLKHSDRVLCISFGREEKA